MGPNGINHLSIDEANELVRALASDVYAMRALARHVGREPDRTDWPAHAWPGGYPIAYLCDDSGTICADCVGNPTNPVHFAGHSDGWKVTSAFLANESDTAVWCDHCNKNIYDPEE